MIRLHQRSLLPLLFQITGYLGELSEGGLEVFDDLKLVSLPRSLAPTLVTLPSMSLIPFASFGGDDVGIERWPRALASASFTARGIETLSVSREAGQPLIPNQC